MSETTRDTLKESTRQSLIDADARERLNCRLAIYAPELFAHVNDYAFEISARWGESDVIYRRVRALIDLIEKP